MRGAGNGEKGEAETCILTDTEGRGWREGVEGGVEGQAIGEMTAISHISQPRQDYAQGQTQNHNTSKLFPESTTTNNKTAGIQTCVPAQE